MADVTAEDRAAAREMLQEPLMAMGFPATRGREGTPITIGYEGLIERIAVLLATTRAAERERATLAERERCARICDQHDDWRWLRATYPDDIQGAGCEAEWMAGMLAELIRRDPPDGRAGEGE